MSVMAAGVHHAGVLRSERKAGLFGDREGVHVRPERDQAPLSLAGDVRQDAGPADPAGIEAELGEPPLDPLGGPRLVPARFGMAVEFATNGDQTTQEVLRDGP
jgi:hypothetical protein